MAYAVFRSDLLAGTDVASAQVMCRVYDANNKPIEVENGTFVELKGYEDDNRDIRKAVLASATSKLADCAVIGSVEVLYDSTKKSLSDFINIAGAPCRGFLPIAREMFGVTKEAFVGATAPAKGATVGFGANGKINPTGTGIGTVEAIETSFGHTYYVIKFGNVEI